MSIYPAAIALPFGFAGVESRYSSNQIQSNMPLKLLWALSCMEGCLSLLGDAVIPVVFKSCIGSDEPAADWDYTSGILDAEAWKWIWLLPRMHHSSRWKVERCQVPPQEGGERREALDFWWYMMYVWWCGGRPPSALWSREKVILPRTS